LYTLFYSEFKYKMKMYIQFFWFFSTLKAFFDEVSTSGWQGKISPAKTATRTPSRYIEVVAVTRKLMTLCNMSDIPDGDEPNDLFRAELWHVPIWVSRQPI
jgi:hypothetical protein